MRNPQLFITLAFCLFLQTGIVAQNQVAAMVAERFGRSPRTEVVDNLFAINQDFSIEKSEKVIEKQTYLTLNQDAANRIISERRPILSLKIQNASGRFWILDMVNFTDEYSDMEVLTGSGHPYDDENRCAMYRGVVRGKENASLVAISIFSGEVYGIIGDGADNITLSKLDGHAEHILYNENDFKLSQRFECATDDNAADPPIENANREPEANICLKMYFETEYDMFQNKGSVANVVNYVKGFHNCVATLFLNEGLKVRISSMKVWDIDDPYTATNGSALLNQFKANTPQNGYNGNMGQLLTFRQIGVGIASTDTLCTADTDDALSVGYIFNGYFSFPDLGIPYPYSWTVNVVTHEFGHTIASPHTHACRWNGNNTAIDGCGQAAGYPEGSCAQGPIPSTSVKGTIMSYCHLNNDPGIAFSNGFGTQPGNLIRTRAALATCLQQCCLYTYTATGVILSGATDTKETTNDITLINKINAHGTGIYHAGEVIVLTDGFYAESDSRLRAYIDYCGGTFVGKPGNNAGTDSTVSQKSAISISPNPASNAINIYSDNFKIRNIRIFTIDGKLVLNKDNINENDLSLNITLLKKGMYILSLDSIDEKNITEKFVKE